MGSKMQMTQTARFTVSHAEKLLLDISGLFPILPNHEQAAADNGPCRKFTWHDKTDPSNC